MHNVTFLHVSAGLDDEASRYNASAACDSAKIVNPEKVPAIVNKDKRACSRSGQFPMVDDAQRHAFKR
jgi:hypothetical protein